MAQRRTIYAFLMVAVYTVATLLSSVSILACEHHHHLHHEQHHCCKSECCAHSSTTIANDCCNHHHPILGDNHTDFIVSRNDTRSALALSLLFSPALVTSLSEELSIYSYAQYERLELRDIGIPSDSRVSGESLRAPPALA